MAREFSPPNCPSKRRRFILRPSASIRPGVEEVGRVVFSSGGRSGKSLVFIGEGGGSEGEWGVISGMLLYCMPGILSASFLGELLEWGRG
jgi:hypothetical protein